MKHLITIIFIIRLFINGYNVETYHRTTIDQCKELTDKIQLYMGELNIEHYIHITEEEENE